MSFDESHISIRILLLTVDHCNVICIIKFKEFNKHEWNEWSNFEIEFSNKIKIAEFPYSKQFVVFNLLFIKKNMSLNSIVKSIKEQQTSQQTSHCCLHSPGANNNKAKHFFSITPMLFLLLSANTFCTLLYHIRIKNSTERKSCKDTKKKNWRICKIFCYVIFIILSLEIVLIETMQQKI